jgi:quinoprotein dehydrogenase-associated probable ABC transporter substrate-binding protein
LFAGKLGEPVSYTYYPQVVGFVRNTLNALRCDVIMGVVVGDTLVQTTNPYYRTTYALVFKPGGGLDGIDSLGDQRLKPKHIGIVAGTPPATLLVEQGLMALARSYALTIDTRVDAPTHTMANDIAAGQIDAGALWGPIAGYYAQRATPPLAVVPLLKESERMDFRIAMGVRTSDQEWKRRLNRLIAESQPKIDRILEENGVPLLDEQGQPIAQGARPAIALWPRQHCASGRRAAADRTRLRRTVDYRMDDYRSPVPAACAGATVLSADAAQAYWEKHDAVFTRRAAAAASSVGLPASTIWRPKPRDDVPGSIWLRIRDAARWRGPAAC